MSESTSMTGVNRSRGGDECQSTEPPFDKRSPVPVTDVNQRIARALDHLSRVQRPDGCWEGEVVWNAMLLAQRVIVRRIVRPEEPIDDGERRRMIRYFE